jgi:hypothetical protein
VAAVACGAATTSAVPKRWLPTDSRQRETHRLLLLVGGEPAAYYLDVCRLMDGDYRLEATTHVVAHLLRELEAALAQVLRPMVPLEAWPDHGVENAHRRRIDAICDALGIGEEDGFRELWRDYALPLAELAHRYSRAAPRPVDAGFREMWNKGQIVVHRLARRIEANYTLALPLVEELAAGAPDVDRLREQVAHSTVVLDRFFERAGADWLGPLRDANYFTDPPPLVYEEDGSVGYSRWPAGRYLARVAPAAPEAVIAIGLGLNTDNPEAHESLVDAALALPAGEAARLRPKVEEWLETPVQWQLPFKSQALVVHLVEGGEVEDGLELLRALIGAARVKRDRYLGAEIIREVTMAIFPAAGDDGLALLADLLTDVIATSRDGAHDYSYIWRPHMNGERRRDLRDALVSAVRDSTEVVVGIEDDRIGDVVALLEARGSSIFRRLALDLLARRPDAALISGRLRDRTLFDDVNAAREFNALAEAHFAALEPEAQQEILSFIAAGPTGDADADENYVGRWQLHMLDRLPQPLPDDWPRRYQELVERYGEPEPERLPEVGFIGPDSPLTRAELEAMDVFEIAAYLREWQPPADGGWRAPSREGLARVLRDLVAESPQRFADEAGAFAEVDPTYVHAVVGGLRQARTSNLAFEWPRVLALAVAVLDRPRRIEGRDPTGFNGEDPGWAWTWQDMAHLIGAGFEGEAPIPCDERERVWHVVAGLADDEHPAAGDEVDGGNLDDAPSLAMNSVRGAGIEAAMGYVWWLRQDVPLPDRHMPNEARELLDRRLDPEVEPTAAVHSLYGKWFAFLAMADPTWAIERLPRIFPVEDERRWRAAWNSYLSFNKVWANVFPLLVEQHRRGIDDLAAEVGEDEVLLGDIGEALVHHLMTAYRYGLLDFDDGSGLLDRFYDVAALERRALALESLGHGLMEDVELTDEMAARLRALWHRRLEAVLDSEDPSAGEELRGFAWWFASGKLDPTWSLTQLAAAVEIGGRVHPDSMVAEQLAALRDDHLPDVVRALELLIESGTRPWFVVGARDDIVAVLASALAADGETAARGRDIVNRLVARGHTNFERLLER